MYPEYISFIPKENSTLFTCILSKTLNKARYSDVLYNQNAKMRIYQISQPKNTENIFTLVIMMPNGKERQITFKKIFIWKKKSFDDEQKKNVLFPSGFCVKVVDVEF